MILATIVLLADLRIASVTPSKPTLTTDETFTVAVKVRNARTEEAKDVKVTIGVNALSYLKTIAAPKGWTCENGSVFGYGLSCTTPSFGGGAEADLTMTLASPQHSAMTYRVGGIVQSATEDGSGPNARAEQGIGIEATDENAELSIIATTEANQVNVEVKNAGPKDAHDVTVAITEAKQLEFKASGSGWKCKGTACTRPLLKAGATASLKVAAVPQAALSLRVRAEKNRESAKDNAAKVTLP